MHEGTADPSTSGGGHGFVFRGVGYDAGSSFATGQGPISRNAWSADQVKAEIGLIANELNGNSVTIYGTDLARLTETATAAADQGLHVWLDPRLPDHSQEQVIEHVAAAGGIAETLRRQGAAIGLTVGVGHSLFTPGILPGQVYRERISNIYFGGDQGFGVRTAQGAAEPTPPDEWFPAQTAQLIADSAGKLNDFLGRVSTVARDVFKGDLTYPAAPWERVDWSAFDYIGLVYYFMPSYLTREQHLVELARYDRWNKPLLIVGFGTASYPGAEKRGMFCWDIVDRTGPVPVVVDGYVRDEGAQADYYRKMLDVFETAGVAGVAPVDLVHPTHPYSTDPRFDLDMASQCLVKTVRDNFDDPTSTYRRETKESFDAVADYYAKARERSAAVAS